MSQKSILRKPNYQSRVVNFAARASAKRNVRFVINEKEETKHAIPERESKYSESQSDTESEHSYSDWDENYNNNENKNEENEMEVDDDPSSDYVPSEEDVSTSEDEDEMEMDDDPSSDYVPSDDNDDEEPEDFDEKVVNVLSSLKYNNLTPSEYLFNWGSEYWYKLESTNAITRENLTSFKRKIQSRRQWINLVNRVKMMVEKERLE